MKKLIPIAAGLLIGAALLYLVFGRLDPYAIAAAIRHASLGWIALAQGFILLNMFVRVVRIKFIAQATGGAHYWRLFRATQVGDFMNAILPLQGGDAIRAFGISRLEERDLLTCAGFVAVDRLTDIMGLIALTLFGLVVYRPTAPVVLPENLFGREFEVSPERMLAFMRMGVVFLSVAAAFCVASCVWPGLVMRFLRFAVRWLPRRAAEAIEREGGAFLRGLDAVRQPAVVLRCMGMTGLVAVGVALTVRCLLAAFHIQAPWYTPLLLPIFIVASLVVSVVPGKFGQFHAGGVIALIALVPGIDVTVAGAFAIAFHLIEFLPLPTFGLVCMYWDGFFFMKKKAGGSCGESFQ